MSEWIKQNGKWVKEMNEQEKNKLLDLSRTLLFAAHGWQVEHKRRKGWWFPKDHAGYDTYEYDYRIVLPPIPDGWRLVEWGENVGMELPLKFIHHSFATWQLLHAGHNYESVSIFVIIPIAKPEPRKVPLTKADWDGHPVWWVRMFAESHELVTGIYNDGVKQSGVLTTYEHLKGNPWQRSHDRITWTPCWKEEA